MDADDFNAKALAGAKLTTGHVTELVRAWQKDQGLEPDGKAGPLTIASIEAELRARTGPPALPSPRCYPLRALPDGRKPTVTSGWKGRNPSRPTHNGCDLFYRYDPTKDAEIAPKVGDGGRTSSGWFIPNDWQAVAVAPGTIALAGNSKTGYRVWIDIGGGWLVGYFHLSSLLVTACDVVAMGTPVGIVGDNPIDGDARHLHFELYYGELGQYPRGFRDPEALLEGARVLTG